MVQAFWQSQVSQFLRTLHVHGAGLALHLSSVRQRQPETLASGDSFVGDNIVHPTAKIGRDCKIGPNVSIGIECEIDDGVRISNAVLLHRVKVSAWGTASASACLCCRHQCCCAAAKDSAWMLHMWRSAVAVLPGDRVCSQNPPGALQGLPACACDASPCRQDGYAGCIWSVLLSCQRPVQW